MQRGEGHVKTEAKMGFLRQQVREHLEPQEIE